MLHANAGNSTWLLDEQPFDNATASWSRKDGSATACYSGRKGEDKFRVTMIFTSKLGEEKATATDKETRTKQLKDDGKGFAP